MNSSKAKSSNIRDFAVAKNTVSYNSMDTAVVTAYSTKGEKK
jgi:hypothetical protein